MTILVSVAATLIFILMIIILLALGGIQIQLAKLGERVTKQSQALNTQSILLAKSSMDQARGNEMISSAMAQLTMMASYVTDFMHMDPDEHFDPDIMNRGVDKQGHDSIDLSEQDVRDLNELFEEDLEEDEPEEDTE